MDNPNTPIAPVRSDAPDISGNCTLTHPAFGCVGAYRVSGHQDAEELFDSKVSHQHYVRLEITPATLSESPYSQSVMGGRLPYISVEMTEAQWVAMVSRMNGPDVPCTVRRRQVGELQRVPGIVPALKFDEAMTQDAARMHEAWNADIAECSDEILRITDKLGVKAKAELNGVLSRMVGHLKANSEYAHEVLTKKKERLVMEGGLEIEAMGNALVSRLGMASLDQLGAVMTADPAALTQLTAASEDTRNPGAGDEA